MIRLVLGVIGLAGVLIALPLLFAGGSLYWADAVFADADGFINSNTMDIEVDGFALVAGPADIEDLPEIPDSPIALGEIATLRIQAQSLDDETKLFIGAAPAALLDEYLGGVPYAVFDDTDEGEMFLSYRMNATQGPLLLPAEQPFWFQSTTGTGMQELEWELTEGDVSLVVMNADASDGMAIETVVGVRIPVLKPVGIGLLVGGGAALALSVLLLTVVL